MIRAEVSMRHAENTHEYAVSVFVSEILWNYDTPFVHQPGRRTLLKLILQKMP
ncbi:hypothetical protein [Herbaspirillum lusitanum]|uniref:hypothetical protein n=1 Tax=Herbaspirillum lusitanum TaxID=213312 RepID=UPI0002FE35CB|nr:hypothetical protein [Herbaspirillum lusitanum]